MTVEIWIAAGCIAIGVVSIWLILRCHWLRHHLIEETPPAIIGIAVDAPTDTALLPADTMNAPLVTWTHDSITSTDENDVDESDVDEIEMS